MLSNDYTIYIHSLCRCRWTPHLPHSGKYWGSYHCSNLDSPICHSQVIVVLGCCLGITPHLDCHIFYLTPLVEVFFRIFESSCHKLFITHGLILVALGLYGWEAFSTPGAFIHTRIIWALSPMAPQVSNVTLESLCAFDVAGNPHG